MNPQDPEPTFPSATEAQALKTLIPTFVHACPDLQEMAAEAAQGILDKYGVKDIEPRSVYFHRFKTAQSSSKTFTGWEHTNERPYESLTLPQLVAQRFRATDQDNADLLDLYGGFYNINGDVRNFNETNQVRLHGNEVLKDLWRIDFGSVYGEKMNSFWALHSDDFRTLGKLNFLAKALDDHGGGRLNNENLKTLIRAVASNVTWPVSRQILQGEATAVEGLRVCALDIGGYVATDMLRIVDRNGCQMLYTPGEIDAFHVFEKPADLHWWLLMQNNRADNRAQFMSHFALSARQQDDDNVGLNNLIDLLYVTWGKSDHHLINQTDQTITGDAFTWLRDSVKSRMQADAALSLHTNGDIRKQLWIGYLNAFTHVFGPMAALGWPAALVVVGAGIADLGLNIDQAVNGTTREQRKAGVVGAILSGVDILFNLPFLKGAAELAEVQEAREVFTPQENLVAEVESGSAALPKIAALAPGPNYAIEGADTLAAFETNEVLDGLSPVSDEGKFQAIYQPDAGGSYVLINDSYYLVRYVNELKTWAIIDPGNPYSFYRSLPIRLNALGDWELIARPGLYGGGKVLGRFPWGRAEAPLPDFDAPATPYDVPEELRPELKSIADGGASPRKLNDQFVDVHNPDNATATFKQLRRALYNDATAFYSNLQLPARPEIPSLSPSAKPKDIIQKLFKYSQGLVIGESHSSVGSKQFLIENMEVLRKQQIKTLYLEHLLTDFHQADLDVFNRTGIMSRDLERYLKALDTGHHTDLSGQFTFLEVVKAARNSHIRIQAIDCVLSYRSAGISPADSTFRQKMMNYFADTVIHADQAARGAHKWVALVGNTHANTYNGVAGISELESAIGLRIESVTAGKSAGVGVDPGVSGPPQLGSPEGVFVRNDLRLQIETPATVTLVQSLDNTLSERGMFTITHLSTSDQTLLVHRSGDNTIVRTPIKRTFNGISIDRPSWPEISGRRFANLEELGAALRLRGMKLVRLPNV